MTVMAHYAEMGHNQGQVGHVYVMYRVEFHGIRPIQMKVDHPTI